MLFTREDLTAGTVSGAARDPRAERRARGEAGFTPLAGTSFVEGQPGTQGGAYFVLSHPERNDEVRGSLSPTSVAGSLLRRYWPRSAPPPRVAYTVPYRVRGEEAAPAEVDAFAANLLADIEATAPAVVVLCGEAALDLLFYAVSGFTSAKQMQGRCFSWQFGKHTAWVVCTYNPSLLVGDARGTVPAYLPFRERELLPFWAAHLRRAADLVLSRDTSPPPPPLSKPFVTQYTDATKAVERLKHIERYLQSIAAGDEVLGEGDPFVGMVSFDIETKGLRPYQSDSVILSFSLTWAGGTDAFAVEHPEATASGKHGPRSVLKALHKVLSAALAVVGQNIGFDLEFCAWAWSKLADGLAPADWARCNETIHDTKLMAYCLDERVGMNSLEQLAAQYGGTVALKQGIDRDRLDELPLPLLLQYNGGDTHATFEIFKRLYDALCEAGLWRFYESQRVTIPVLVEMQLDGLPVDQTVRAELRAHYGGLEQDALRRFAQSEEVKQFVVRYGKQPNTGAEDVSKLCRGVLNLCVESTDEAALLPHAETHPILGVVLEARGAAKLRGVLDPLDPADEDTVIHPDGLIHANYNLTSAVTGRLSCSSPNNQNWPKRQDGRVRSVVRPPPGWLIYAFDYAQLEARVIAMHSGDRAFIDALWEGRDVHLTYAELYARLYPASVEIHGGSVKKLRTEVKNRMTFPAFFGASESSIAKSMQVPSEVAAEVFEAFWTEFAGVKAWQERLNAYYERNLYVTCLSGRRRRGPLAYNKILNSPIQADGRDIVVDAMNRCSDFARETGDAIYRPRINIHDDLTFFAPRERGEDLIENVSRIMTSSLPWTRCVPIVIEASVGSNWYEMKEILKVSSTDFGHVRKESP